MTPQEQDLFDAVVINALDILRLSASERAATLALLAKMEKALTAALNGSELDNASRAKVEKFLGTTDDIIGEHYDQVETRVEHSAIAQIVSEATASTLEVVLGVEAEPPTNFIKAAKSDVLIQGAPQAEWWKAQAEDTKLKFKAEVRKGLLSSETNQQIISRIVGKNGEPGVMDAVRNNASSLVTTSVQSVANEARRQTFQANGDIVKGLRQISTLDSHTSLVCSAYSGAAWDLEYEPVAPNNLPFKGGCPRHFNCRSVEVPITKTFRELGVDIDEAGGTRASVDGQIDRKTTFDSFLKTKSKAFQDELLGEGRAELYRAGKITLRDLVNGNGNPLSLAQLQNKYNRTK